MAEQVDDLGAAERARIKIRTTVVPYPEPLPERVKLPLKGSPKYEYGRGGVVPLG